MDPADKRVAARVEAMQRELSSVIRSDEKLNQEYRVDPEDLVRVDPENERTNIARSVWQPTTIFALDQELGEQTGILSVTLI
jgi:hypothetical protein